MNACLFWFSLGHGGLYVLKITQMNCDFGASPEGPPDSECVRQGRDNCCRGVAASVDAESGDL